MGKKFKVSPGCQVQHPKMGLLKAGSVFDAGDFDKHHLNVYQQERFILEVQNTPQVGEIREDGSVEIPPGSDKNRPALTLLKDNKGDLVSTEIRTATAPQGETLKVQSGIEQTQPDGAKTTIVREDGEEREQVAEVTGKPTADASPWVLDPEKLKGKSVDELNAMVYERAPEGETGKPFDTVEEAISFLSQDFKG